MPRMKAMFAAVLSLAVLSACGTPCSRIANAENAANEKGKACNSKTTAWDSARLQKCESGLSKCSPDDTKQLDAYADCLNKLDVCVDGQSLSWGLQRLGCVEPLTKVSLACTGAIN